MKKKRQRSGTKRTRTRIEEQRWLPKRMGNMCRRRVVIFQIEMEHEHQTPILPKMILSINWLCGSYLEETAFTGKQFNLAILILILRCKLRENYQFFFDSLRWVGIFYIQSLKKTENNSFLLPHTRQSKKRQQKRVKTSDK